MDNASPRIFRVVVPVKDAAASTTFYARLLGTEPRAVGGGRTYFDAGGVILAMLEQSAQPSGGGVFVYFSVKDLEAVHARAKELGCLSKEDVHGAPAGDIVVRPWRERSFYVVDPSGNELCFVDEGTLFTGR